MVDPRGLEEHELSEQHHLRCWHIEHCRYRSGKLNWTSSEKELCWEQAANCLRDASIEQNMSTAISVGLFIHVDWSISSKRAQFMFQPFLRRGDEDALMCQRHNSEAEFETYQRCPFGIVNLVPPQLHDVDAACFNFSRGLHDPGKSRRVESLKNNGPWPAARFSGPKDGHDYKTKPWVPIPVLLLNLHAYTLYSVHTAQFSLCTFVALVTVTMPKVQRVASG
jgi:hypothetical protein